MITLPTEQVRTFLRYAAAVKPNVLYPALDCIKIEGDGKAITYTKTNNNVYCIASYPSEQKFTARLVNERSIAGLLMVAQSPEVTIGGQTMKCGERKVTLPVQEAAMYPQTPDQQPFLEEVSDAALGPIRTAAKYYSRLPMITVMSYIHADKRGVFASNGHMTYHYATPVPQLLFDEEIANIVAGLKNVKYSSAGNYDFYSNDEVAYGFIRKECPAWKYENVLDGLKGDASFTIDRAELLKFCSLVEYTTKQENPVAVMSGVDANLSLLHEDHDFGTGAEDNIEMVATADVAPFKFNIKTVGEILRSLPFTTLTFTLCGKHYKLTSTDDANYTGIISALQN